MAARSWFIVLGALCLISLWATAQAEELEAMTTVATAFSSKMSHRGERVMVILNHAVTLPEGSHLLSGTQLLGKIDALEYHAYDEKRAPTTVHLLFTQALLPTGDRVPIQAEAATPDGRLHPEEPGVLVFSPDHSFATLRSHLRATLGYNRGLWNQKLGINQSSFVDWDTDDFIVWYNRYAVLVGVGDQLKLLFHSL